MQLLKHDDHFLLLQNADINKRVRGMKMNIYNSEIEEVLFIESSIPKDAIAIPEPYKKEVLKRFNSAIALKISHYQNVIKSFEWWQHWLF